MKYKDLRDFIEKLEQKGLLKRVHQEIDTDLEMTEIADRRDIRFESISYFYSSFFNNCSSNSFFLVITKLP